jgi:hypothetical protein
MVARYKGHRSELDLPSLSALVFTGCFSPYDWPSKDTSLWGGPTTYKACQFEMWKQMFDPRSATFVLAKMGSDTITTATLLSPATSARWCSSPFAGLKVKSMGSSVR